MRQLVKRLRKLEWLVQSGFEVEFERLRWVVPTDVSRFLAAVEGGQWEAALACYQGPFLSPMQASGAGEFEGWLELERERLHARWRTAVLERARELEGNARPLAAASLYACLLEADGLDEDALRALMAALWQGGRSAEALRVYRTFVARLEDELGLAPTAATEKLARELEALRRQPAPTPTPATASSHMATPPTTTITVEAAAQLPSTGTSFIGRDLELSEIAHLLAKPDCRLLTLLGLGGAGKSRIALQVVEELSPRYRDGARFVALDALTSAHDLPGEIGRALQLNLQGDDPLFQLERQLADKHLLLVLDNFEHLVNNPATTGEPSVADGVGVVLHLIRRCPALDVLVTSRQRLNLEEEWLLPIEGLAFPATDALPVEDALQYDAVQLFVQRAQRVQPHFTLHARELADLIEICRLVAGFPLGLELGNRLGVANSLEGLARVASARGQLQRAAALWGAAFAVHEAIGVPFADERYRGHKESAKATRAQLGDGAFARAWERGRVMTLEQAVAYATSQEDATV